MDENTQYILDLNKENLDRVIGFVDVMDSKAKFILTLVLALTAYLATQLGPYLDAHGKWGTLTSWAPTFFILLDLVGIGCLVCFIATAITVICAISPTTTQHSGRHSPLFFGTIAAVGIEDFKNAMKTLTPNNAIDLLADQTYDNAKIVTKKTAHVRRSITFFYYGMGCFFIFTIGRPILLSLVAR
jgi:Family of unknown function (DUF5706)